MQNLKTFCAIFIAFIRKGKLGFVRIWIEPENFIYLRIYIQMLCIYEWKTVRVCVRKYPTFIYDIKTANEHMWFPPCRKRHIPLKGGLDLPLEKARWSVIHTLRIFVNYCQVVVCYKIWRRQKKLEVLIGFNRTAPFSEFFDFERSEVAYFK